MATRRRGSSADDAVGRYARAVLAGAVVAGPHVRNACRRHLTDLDRGHLRGLTWDRVAAEYAIDFFPTILRLAGGKFEGQPFVLEPSQKFIIGSIFGWKRGNGTRRFRRVYIEEGKGNGKSPISAGIGLFCLLCDGEPRAEVYAAASQKSQAMVLFRAAVAMWQQSDGLKRRLTPSGANPIWNLADLSTGSFFRPISSEEGYSGPLPSCGICDEVHEMRDGTMIEMLERGFKSRRQPLLIMITNSGTDRQSACWQEHQYAVEAAAGTRTPGSDFAFVGEPIHDETFSYVCALDSGDDPLEDASCWVKANPLLAITMPVDELERAVAQAKAIPGKLNGVLRLHFCVWTDVEQAWMARAALEAVLEDFDPIEYEGADAVLGLDLSSAQDLTALAAVVRTGSVEVPRENGELVRLPTFAAWVEAWTPADTIAGRALRDQAPYDLWAQQGWLHAVPGRNIRLDFVAARTVELASEVVVEKLVYDRYAFARFADELDQLGLTVEQLEHPQGGVRRAKESGLWMPGSVAALESLILERRIRLQRSPVLISAMMSAAVERDPFDNRWFSKRRAVNRIDALIALTMAIGAATAGGDHTSVYEERGLLVL
jgi:phage terminase large subunit-like protein